MFRAELYGIVLLLSISVKAVLMETSSTRLKGKLTSDLPPQMTSDIPGTWAFDTMSRRVVEEIIPRIINDNTDELTKPSSSHRSECLLVINDLISSLKAGEGGYLRGIADAGSDCDTWADILRTIPDERRNWRQAPWIVSEFYLYRRLAEAFRFFETGYDMFSKQKVSGLIEALPNIQEIAGRLEALIASDSKSTVIELAVLTSLWGNKMDLSLWPASKRKVATTSTLSLLKD